MSSEGGLGRFCFFEHSLAPKSLLIYWLALPMECQIARERFPRRAFHIRLFRLRDSQQQNIVTGNFQRHVVGQEHLLARPEIFRLLRAVKAQS